MATERLVALRQQLTELINDELHDANSAERLRWLTERLEIYVIRWVGFCSNTTLAFSSLINTDLHYIVLVAAEKINEELALRHANEERAPAWHRFVRLMNSIDERASQQVGAEVSQEFDLAKQELMALCRGSHS